MHAALVPFLTQALAAPGYDSIFRPTFILHNMAEGGEPCGENDHVCAVQQGAPRSGHHEIIFPFLPS